MRDIGKYRGKRKNNGEMVYGYYIHTDFADYIVPSKYVVNWKVFIEVIPETVGESTGLKDKNGVDLDWWEGDLIKEGQTIKEITLIDGCFWLQWMLHPTRKTPLYECKAWAEHLTKVGNIHEESCVNKT